MGIIIRANRKYANEVTLLRYSEYSSSRQFTLTDEAKLSWDECDDKSIVLLAKDDKGKPLATMRGEFHTTQDSLEESLEGEVPVSPTTWPALVLSRGATCKDGQYQGLNSLLRFHLFQLAKEQNVSHIYGVVYSGAPRINLMQQLGYTFHTSKKSFKGRTAHTDVLIAVLDFAKQGDKALTILFNKTEELQKQFPLVN